MKGTWLGLIMLFCVITLSAIIPPEYAPMPLPSDPDLVSGTLENGLTYYILRNAKPENRIEVRLMVDAGSINEDDDQLGLAHFTEHMAFNGSKNFPRTDMVNYLTSIGMGFHNGLNGGTSYDRTFYMFKLPTEDEPILRKGLSIMSDIAWQLDMATDEIERERGIILEEWRLGQSAQQRIQDQIDKVRFAGSRYAQRNPIGTVEVLKSFKPESLRRFYQDWYRPDLMSVIIVGDYEPARLEAMVKEYFGVIPKRANPRPKEIYTVPDNTEPRAITVLDKEQPYTMLQATWKMDSTPVVDLGTYYNDLKHDLFYTMFNARMQEISQQPNPPFSYAFGYSASWLEGFNASTFMSVAAEGRSEDAFRVMITELARIRQHGFVPGEFDRAKLELIRNAETALAKKPTVDSGERTWQIIGGLITKSTVISAEALVDMVKNIIPEIGLQEVNELIDDIITPDNLTLSLSGTEKEGGKYPGKDDLLRIYEEVRTAQQEPYVDTVVNEPLIDKIPAPGKIASQSSISKSGINKWVLSNGVTVYSKKTDFKADEVLLTAKSPGGLAALSPKDYKLGGLFTGYFFAGGFGNFDGAALQKALAGKVAQVYPTIDEYSEGWEGSCSPKDLELMFQMLYQYATVPRFDEGSFSASISMLRSFTQNSLLDPETAFSDTMDALLYNNHPLKRELHPEDLDKLSLKQLEKAYRDRFADFSDFTFHIVGNFDEEQLKTYCTTYLANLPTIKRKDKIRDVGIKKFSGKNVVKIAKGSERSFVSNASFGKAKISQDEMVLNGGLMHIANEKLRENVRENMSGVYVVAIWNAFDHYPKPGYKVQTWMACDPGRAEELNKAIFATLDSLRSGSFEEKYLDSAKTTSKKRFEESIKSNRYWISSMSANVFNNQPIDSFVDNIARYEKLDKPAIVKAARKYFNFDKSRLSVYMLPQE